MSLKTNEIKGLEGSLMNLFSLFTKKELDDWLKGENSLGKIYEKKYSQAEKITPEVKYVPEIMKLNNDEILR
jgi:hypothetical protein